MKPSIGRIVIAATTLPCNGSLEHPGIITRVWNGVDPAEGGPACVNVKVLPDGGVPFDLSSCTLFETREAAQASGCSAVCWWPERV